MALLAAPFGGFRSIERYLASLAAELAESHESLSVGAGLRLSSSFQQGEDRASEDEGGLPSETPYEGILAVTGTAGSIDEVLDSFHTVRRVNESFDRARSVGVAGTAETLAPVTSNLAYLRFMRRALDEPTQRFHDHWRTGAASAIQAEHGHLQIHAVESYGRELASRAGIGASDIDGVDELYAVDVADLRSLYPSLLGRAEATDGTERIDIGRSFFGVYRWIGRGSRGG